MLGLIGFDSYCIHCIIGTESNERETAQELLVDLKVEIDLSQVAASGLLKNTIDYCALADICKELAIEGKYLLIEKYAADVVQMLLLTYPITSVWIRVRKPKAIAGAAYAMVELKRERQT